MSVGEGTMEPVLPEIYNASTTFLDENLAAGRGGRTAIRFEGRSIAYGELAGLVNRAGHALRALGVRREERVAILLSDRPEFVATFFGAIRIGAVPVPLNTLLKPADYRTLLEDCRARVLVTEPALAAAVREIRAGLCHLETTVVAEEPGPGELALSDLLSGRSDALEPVPTHRDEPAFWLYSSGSTGLPKGAVHLHHDMACCADRYAGNVLGIGPEDRTFSLARLFFAYGLGNSAYFPMRVGASAVLVPHRPKPEEAFEVIERERPTIFFGVPAAFAAMLQVEGAERRFDLGSLRLCVSAGEALPAEIGHRWKRRFGLEILDGVGSTELLHIYISNRPGKVRPGSSGLPVPGYEIRIVDEEGGSVPDGETGNLWVKGESASPWYWNRHAQTKRSMRGEWFVSGDKYTRDADGYYWYQGRADDMLKSGGIWVSPVEVEGVLVEHPAVLEAAVVGWKDPDGVTWPKAFVVLAAGSQGSPELAYELVEHVRARLAAYKRPRWIEFLSALPKTATGKVQRFRLREG